MKHKAPICLVCEKTLSINPKWMISTYCKPLTHLHCTNTKLLTISDTKNAKESTCLSSNSIELPFHKVKDIESNKNYTSVHHEKYNGLKK